MPRENSLSDSDGRSLTPDLDEEHDPAYIGPSSPVTEPSSQSRFSYAPARHREDANDATLVHRAKTHHSALRPKISTSLGTRSSGTSSSLQRAKTQGTRPTTPPFVTSTSAPSAVPPRADAETTSRAVPGAARARFQASVRKIILSRRTSTALSGTGIGAEPGIDPRRSSAYVHYGHIRQRCTIDIVDYSSLRSSFGRMENKGFAEYAANDAASAREPWVKVRWINIGGISWDVMSALALKYDIHPLALEDVMHQRSTQARSKADYYHKHLFIRILRHCLGPDDEDGPSILRPFAPPQGITDLPRSSSPKGWNDDEELNDGNASDDDETKYAGTPNVTKRDSRKSGLFKLGYHSSTSDIEKGPRQSLDSDKSFLKKRKYAANALAVESLKKGERVPVQVSPMFLFLFRDGTVISITTRQDPDFTAPIVSRLRQRDTVLRQTADASLLVQSLLDLVVDQGLEVVDEYQKKILKLEHDILIRPQVKTVRYLHILSADLTSNKRTLEPIKTLIYGIRRYDVDRCAALLDSAGAPKEEVEGFMSHKAKIYLADVHDHMDYILSSMDMFSSVAENLINYTFNMASYEMNEVMQRLTTATIIFLPLTLLTGYFGMNFESQWSVQQNSDVLFWIIALPVMAIIVPIFMWSDIGRLYHFCKKRWTVRRVEKRFISMKKRQ